MHLISTTAPLQFQRTWELLLLLTEVSLVWSITGEISIRLLTSKIENLKLTPLRLAGVPPPMAHNELKLDSNVVDVAFSKSGTRVAVLMDRSFSIFLWSLKSRPVPAPILESSYPLSDAPASRPRQIAFVNDNEVYVLKDSGPNASHIEVTALETRLTCTVYQAANSEQLSSIFAGIGHKALWFSHARQAGHPVGYSSISRIDADNITITPWTESPSVETHWARAVSISEDEVSSPRNIIFVEHDADHYSES